MKQYRQFVSEIYVSLIDMLSRGLYADISFVGFAWFSKVIWTAYITCADYWTLHRVDFTGWAKK